jgi:hypothetical protein
MFACFCFWLAYHRYPFPACRAGTRVLKQICYQEQHLSQAAVLQHQLREGARVMSTTDWELSVYGSAQPEVIQAIEDYNKTVLRWQRRRQDRAREEALAVRDAVLEWDRVSCVDGIHVASCLEPAQLIQSGTWRQPPSALLDLHRPVAAGEGSMVSQMPCGVAFADQASATAGDSHLAGQPVIIASLPCSVFPRNAQH